MAVEKCEAGIVGYEVDFVGLVSAQHDDVFEDTGGGGSSELCELEAVTMEMDGMDIVTGVAHTDAVALALI